MAVARVHRMPNPDAAFIAAKHLVDDDPNAVPQRDTSPTYEIGYDTKDPPHTVFCDIAGMF